MIETINKLIRTSRYLVQEFGREPTPEEIAEKMELPLDKVRKVLKIAKEPISLETPIGEEEDSHLGDFIEDKSVVSPAEAVIKMNLSEQTRKVLKTLTPREEKVLRMRFGIGEKSDHTLEEVGQDFEVTRERIRQIEAKALRKLSSSPEPLEATQVVHRKLSRSRQGSQRMGFWLLLLTANAWGLLILIQGPWRIRRSACCGCRSARYSALGWRSWGPPSSSASMATSFTRRTRTARARAGSTSEWRSRKS